MTEPEITNVCNRCKEERQLAKFSKCKTERDGLQRTCKDCQKAYRIANAPAISEKDKRYYENNKPRIISRVNAYTESHRDAVIEFKREWYQRNKERLSSKNKKYRDEHKDTIREQRKKYKLLNGPLPYKTVKDMDAAEIVKRAAIKRRWRLANPDAESASKTAYRIKNPYKVALANRLWAQRNRGKRNAIEACRRAAKLRATPQWVERSRIQDIYTEVDRRSKTEGVVYHVDHIVPLQSEFVCGLHCLSNLQIIPGKENISKGNRTWPGQEWVLTP
jgi:hypothetical protein